MRHSRAVHFRTALDEEPDGIEPEVRWPDVADDPNEPRALLLRTRSLAAAWRPAIEDRVSFLVERCRGRRVLDIGCVAHDAARMASPNWLHARLAAVAASCVGVDVDRAGVERMRAASYEAVHHDLTAGTGPLGALDPFDVIVAGEVIEHVGSLDMLFEAAVSLLAPTGELIITTPNPWAPHRVRAGQRGHVWENVDHISYAFPSGVVELASRHGLALHEAATTVPRRWYPGSPTAAMKAIKRRLLGRQWVTVGFDSLGPAAATSIRQAPGAWLASRLRPSRRRFVGESFVYVVGRP